MHGYSDRINHAFAFAAKYYGAVAPVGRGNGLSGPPRQRRHHPRALRLRAGDHRGGILHHVLEETPPDQWPVMEHKISEKFGPVALAVARDALEPKFDRRGGERPWQACKQEYLTQLATRSRGRSTSASRTRSTRAGPPHRAPAARRGVPADGLARGIGTDHLVVPIAARNRGGAGGLAPPGHARASCGC